MNPNYLNPNYPGQEQDAELVATLREALHTLAQNPNWTFRQALRHIRPDGDQPALVTYARATLRQLDQLKRIVEDLPEELDQTADALDAIGHKLFTADILRKFAKAIRVTQPAPTADKD